MISDRMDINRVLLEMRSLQAQTKAFAPVQSADVNPLSGSSSLRPITETPSFGQIMSQAVNKVDGLQKSTGSLRTSFEQGQSGVDITDVMIASQKSSVAFQSMLQVRNKLVESYRDIMNMPV
ncbi:MAG: flagellar hook-basal body complex protein FliE [Pseudohongiellaceae bacterium]|jgi:flagellar hook-basal body complex protein FliE